MKKLLLVIKILVYALPILFFLYIALIISGIGSGFSTSNDVYYYGFETDPDSAFIKNLSPDLPHTTYVHLLDSARMADNRKRYEITNNLTGFSNGRLGAYKTVHNSVASQPANLPSYFYSLEEMQYARSLTNYTPSESFKKNGRYYLKYYDTVLVNGRMTYKIFTKEVPFLFDAQGKRLLFPITKTTYSLMYTFIIAFAFINLVAMLCIPFNLIHLGISIAEGAFFTEKNKRRLTLTARFIVFIIVSPLLVNLLAALPHLQTIKPYFTSSLSVFNQVIALLAALLIWLLSKAFNKGLQLQQEHDLTV